MKIRSGLEHLTETERLRAATIAAALHKDVYSEYSSIVQPGQTNYDDEFYDERISEHDLRVAVRDEVNQTLHLNELSERHDRTRTHTTDLVKNEISRHQPPSFYIDRMSAFQLTKYVTPGQEAIDLVREVQEYFEQHGRGTQTKDSLDQLPDRMKGAVTKYLDEKQQGYENDLTNGARLVENGRAMWSQEHPDVPLQGQEAEGFLPFWLVIRSPSFLNERIDTLYVAAANYAHAQTGPVSNQETLQKIQEVLPQGDTQQGYEKLAEAIGKRAYALHKTVQEKLSSFDRLSSEYYFSLTRAAAAEIITEQLMEIGLARGYDKSRLVADEKLNEKKQLRETMQQLPPEDQRLVRDWHTYEEEKHYTRRQDSWEQFGNFTRALLRQLTERGLIEDTQEYIPDRLFSDNYGSNTASEETSYIRCVVRKFP